MYTLRIIDQTKVGAEERRNIFIGDEYSVLMSVPQRDGQEPMKDWDNKFENALKKFHGGMEDGEDIKIDPTIIGFVYNAHGAVFAIRNYEVVYIVGSEGQTIERVYGQYVKY